METPNTETMDTPKPRRRKKKGHKGLIIFLVILVLAAAGGGGYYFLEKQQPKKAVEQFLTSAQKMDFTAMEKLLQSQDLTVLDNADIRTEAFAEFFRNVNSKMTFKITGNDFNIQNGTAQVTAKINYIDGTDIYMETISEFLRQIVSSAFSDESLTEEETQQKLASILTEASLDAQDKFAETSVTYPLIKTKDGWRIVSLDAETVKFMSANITNVEDEINASLSQMETDAASDTPAAGEGDSIDMTNEKFTIHYTQHRIAKDFAGNPCLMLYYDYTNNGTSASSAMVDVNIQAYQDGAQLTAAIPESNEDAVDRFMSEIEPGQTVNVCQVFTLASTSDITIQASEAFSLGGGQTTSQILKAQ